MSRSTAVEEPRRDPLSGPMAWYGREMASRTDWLRSFDEAEIAEIEAAVAQVRRLGCPLTEVGRESFPLPTLGPTLRECAHELIDGRGFVQLRGLPVERWSLEETACAYWGIARWLGRPVTQNRLGHLLGHVRDLGVDPTQPDKRGYQSNAPLSFHQDVGGDVVSLLCLRPAKAGGLSSLASAWTVHNEILARRPDLLEALLRPTYRDRREEIPPGRPPWYLLPTFAYQDGRLVTNFVRRFAESAERFADARRLTAEEREAFDVIDAIANEDGIRLDIDFRPGDVQFVNNLTILHARTGYEDWPEPERRRHLLRFWIALPDAWPLPRAWYERNGIDEETGRPSGILVPGMRETLSLQPT